MIRALALATLCACGSGGGFPDAPGVPDAARPGTFSLSWTIDNAMGQMQTCMQASASYVIVDLHEQTTGSSLSGSFHCDLGSAFSGSVAIGTYDITFELTGTGGTLAMAPPQMGVVIMSTKTTPLAPVVFTLP